LTLAQKKEVAKHIFEREPGRTDRSIAKEIGLSPSTVASVREEVESNVQNGHYEAEVPRDDLGRDAEKSARRVTRKADGSVRSAPGRKPLSPEEKAARANARAAAKAEAQKETKPKPLTSARDDAVNMLSDVILNNLYRLQDIVQIIAGYDGVIHQKFTLGQRHEMVRKFAKALGVSIAA